MAKKQTNNTIPTPKETIIEIVHVLTAAELAATRKQHQAAAANLRQIEENSKVSAAEYKEKISKSKAEVSKLTDACVIGSETRTVSAILTLDFEGQRRVYADPKTGAELKTAPLTEADRQQELELVAAENRKREKEATDAKK